MRYGGDPYNWGQTRLGPTTIANNRFNCLMMEHKSAWWKRSKRGVLILVCPCPEIQCTRGLAQTPPAEYKKRDFQEHIVVICLPFEKVIGVKELCHVAICHALTSQLGLSFLFLAGVPCPNIFACLKNSYNYSNKCFFVQPIVGLISFHRKITSSIPYAPLALDMS